MEKSLSVVSFLRLIQDRGAPSFDIRHTLTSALTYAIPSPATGIGHSILGGFALDSFLRSRSARPVNILTGRDPLGLGLLR